MNLMEDEQYKELTDFIGGQFNRVWNEFDKVHGRIDAVDKKLEVKFNDLKNDFRQLQSAVDSYRLRASNLIIWLGVPGKIDFFKQFVNKF